ncbi:MAG: hypothetical protein Q9201_005851 [Fulgogasparrea decipioides]
MSPRRKPAFDTQPPKKARRTAQEAPRYSNSMSVNALKSKIRDVTRVLEHAQTLPMDVRIEKERALAGYRQDLEKANNEREKQRMIKKYHMVRFFERQKATRNLKKLRTRLASAVVESPEYQSLQNEIHDAEVDLNYTLYYPLAEKYVSLFPRGETPKEQARKTTLAADPRQIREIKPAIWEMVESCMENGTLQALRDRVLRTSAIRPRPRQPVTPKPGSRDVKKKQQQQHKKQESGSAASLTANEGEVDSDTGFFDE